MGHAPQTPPGPKLIALGISDLALTASSRPDPHPAIANHTGDNWGFCALYWLTKDFGYGRMFADSKVVGRVPPDENGQTKSPSAFC